MLHRLEKPPNLVVVIMLHGRVLIAVLVFHLTTLIYPVGYMYGNSKFFRDVLVLEIDVLEPPGTSRGCLWGCLMRRCLWLVAQASVVYCSSSQLEIMNSLLVDYDKTMRPRHPALLTGECSSSGEPDSVVVLPAARRLHSVDQVAKTWHLEGSLTLVWSDWRLNFTSLSCIDRLTFTKFEDAGGIWYPDVVVDEAQLERFGGEARDKTSGGERLHIRRDGLVEWTRRLSVQLACNNMVSSAHM